MATEMNGMLAILIEEEGRDSRLVRVPKLPCRLGRGREADVQLPGWRVAKVHAELQPMGRGIKLVDMGTIAGTRVNGERVVEYGPLLEQDEIRLPGYRIMVQGEALRHGRMMAGFSETDEHANARVCDARTGSGMVMSSDTPGTVSTGPAQQDEFFVADKVNPDGGSHAPECSHSRSGKDHAAAEYMMSQRVGEPSTLTDEAENTRVLPEIRPDHSLHQKPDFARMAQAQLQALGWRRRVHRQLLEVIDLRRSNLTQFSADEVRAEVYAAVKRIVAEMDALPSEIDRELLIQDTVDEAVGLGPLERLMDDPLISEIMVNGVSDIFIERQGVLQKVPLAFSDDEAIRNVIERIVAPLGRRIDESCPLVDARLSDGSRVNAIIPPVALKGPTVTIRRFNRTLMTPETLLSGQSASAAMMAFLRICVEQRKSIIVSGGTGSGKTTLLNVLSNLIPAGERLITIEDAAELKLAHAHLVSLEARPPNAEGRGAISIRDLVRNALRMRPDRIIVGECRGAEALDMLQAMNTGHEGSMTTVHANTPRDVLSRLEVLMLMAGIELPLTALREQIASAVDLIIHQARFSDGARRITSITEVCGVESGKIQLQEIFRYEQTGMKGGRIQGRFRACNAVPSFYEALRARGVAVDLDIFEDAMVQA